MNYKAIIKRLGLACALMVDPLTKASACSLRNKLSEIPVTYGTGTFIVKANKNYQEYL